MRLSHGGAPGVAAAASGDRDRILSGGERQRTGFARLLIQKPRPIVMDEATLVLDDARQNARLKLLPTTRAEKRRPERPIPPVFRHRFTGSLRIGPKHLFTDLRLSLALRSSRSVRVSRIERMTGRISRWFAASVAVIWFGLASPAMAQADGWTVAKTSGEAWTGSGAQPASLSQQVQLKPGDSVRTGRNGRVLLVRGQETILLSPNSAISLPEAGRPGLSTVIQQAGSILLDVEKRNVQHFEVETPFLAAVVKGTRFRVSITGGTAKVDVVRGQVQVTDFRSGERALVNPQQFARSSTASAIGLRLGGAGRLDSVMPGAPQAPRVAPLSVPAGGLRPGADAVPLQQTQPAIRASGPATRPTTQASAAATQPAVQRTAGGGARIVAPIGEVKLDIRKLTNGMARSGAQEAGRGRGQDWAARLQPGNGDNSPGTGNSGTAPATAASAAAQGRGEEGFPGQPAAVGRSLSAVAADAAAKAGSAKTSNAPQSAGRDGVTGAPGQQSNQGRQAQAGQSAGQLLQTVYGGVSASSGREGSDPRGSGNAQGNAFGLYGGNGVGKALGLSKR